MAAELFEVVVELPADACVLCHFNDGAFVIAHLVHQRTDAAFPLVLGNRARHEVKLLHAGSLEEGLAHKTVGV